MHLLVLGVRGVDTASMAAIPSRSGGRRDDGQEDAGSTSNASWGHQPFAFMSGHTLRRGQRQRLRGKLYGGLEGVLHLPGTDHGPYRATAPDHGQGGSTCVQEPLPGHTGGYGSGEPQKDKGAEGS